MASKKTFLSHAEREERRRKMAAEILAGGEVTSVAMKFGVTTRTVLYAAQELGIRMSRRGTRTVAKSNVVAKSKESGDERQRASKGEAGGSGVAGLGGIAEGTGDISAAHGQHAGGI